MTGMDDIDRRIIAATQDGLPLCPQPYHAVADKLALPVHLVMERMQRMLELGVIRRMGVIPNHYALGVRANGMTVWQLPDQRLRAMGRQVGALDFVSHCYHRPPHPPEWPYNLFAMVHGHNRREVERKVEVIAELLGADDLGHEILYSTRLLKKTGLRI